MQWHIVTLLILVVPGLAACAVNPAVEPATNPAIDPKLHGETPAEQTNTVGQRGPYEVSAQTVEYIASVQGHYATPASEGPFPGVVMIHEWWGLNEHIKAMAEHLASHGYAVLAVDLYEGTVATTPGEARAAMQAVDQEAAVANMQAAADYLRVHGAERVASLGWCFGGAQSLQLSLNEPVDATVIYYGRPVTDPEALSALDAPVLGIFAANDASIPQEQVRDFDLALMEADIERDIYLFEGAEHAFANPSGDRFNRRAAEEAWGHTLTFLAQQLTR